MGRDRIRPGPAGLVGLADEPLFGDPHPAALLSGHDTDLTSASPWRIWRRVARDVGAARSAVDAALAAAPGRGDLPRRPPAGAVRDGAPHGRSGLLGRRRAPRDRGDAVRARHARPAVRTTPKDGGLAVVTGSPGSAARSASRSWPTSSRARLGSPRPRPRRRPRPGADGRCRARRRRRPLDRGAAGLPGAAEQVAALLALDPRPLVVLGGQLWGAGRARTPPTLGADLVVDGPRSSSARCGSASRPSPPTRRSTGSEWVFP